MSDLNLLQQIQTELVEPSHLFSNTLRKALILASRVNSESLKLWVRQESNGYTDSKTIPEYRKLSVRSFYDYHIHTRIAVTQYSRIPINLDVEYVHQYEISMGISNLEDLINRASREPNAVVQIEWEPYIRL